MNGITCCVQGMLLVAPALFTLLYSLFAYRKANLTEDFPSIRWAVNRRCGVVAFIFWCAYLFFTFVTLTRSGVLDFTSNGFWLDISFKLFSILIGILSVLPLIGSVILYMLAAGWVDRRKRKEKFSLLSFLRVSLALWIWEGDRVLLCVIMLLSQTFFFTLDGGSLAFNILNTVIILSLTMFVSSCSFPLTCRLFGLTFPLDNQHLKAKADDFGNRLEVSVKQLFLVRTFDVPIVNAFALSNGNIYLADKMVDTFETDEIEAILAHEVGHLKHIKKLSMVGLCFSICTVLLVLGVSPLVFGNVIDIRYMLFYLIIEINVLLRIISKEKQYQRKCEMKADSLAVDLVDPDTYVRALKHLDTINMIPDKFSERERKYLSHPPLEERINHQRS